jgi:hypothetical protein
MKQAGLLSAIGIIESAEQELTDEHCSQLLSQSNTSGMTDVVRWRTMQQREHFWEHITLIDTES